MTTDAIFIVGNIPVHVRELPSGDMAVWHPFNERIRNIIEPLCRGKGYWQRAHRNWIIRQIHVTEVLTALATVGVHHA